MLFTKQLIFHTKTEGVAKRYYGIVKSIILLNEMHILSDSLKIMKEEKNK
jgi:hypothetical protein